MAAVDYVNEFDTQSQSLARQQASDVLDEFARLTDSYVFVPLGNRFGDVLRLSTSPSDVDAARSRPELRNALIRSMAADYEAQRHRPNFSAIAEVVGVSTRTVQRAMLD